MPKIIKTARATPLVQGVALAVSVTGALWLLFLVIGLLGGRNTVYLSPLFPCSLAFGCAWGGWVIGTRGGIRYWISASWVGLVAGILALLLLLVVSPAFLTTVNVVILICVPAVISMALALSGANIRHRKRRVSLQTISGQAVLPPRTPGRK